MKLKSFRNRPMGPLKKCLLVGFLIITALVAYVLPFVLVGAAILWIYHRFFS